MSFASYLFGFGPSVDINIYLQDEESREKIEYKTGKEQLKEAAPLYYDGESVSGKVVISVGQETSFTHHGIKAEFIGAIEMYYDRGQTYNFVTSTKELAAPFSTIKNTVAYTFDFKNAEKQYETYIGINVRLRYFVRVTVQKKVGRVEKEKDIWVHWLPSSEGDGTTSASASASASMVDNSRYLTQSMPSSIKMEVGIEDCLHLEFEYNKTSYHLKDVIVGKIYFLLVRIKIKHMELCIVRRETTGSVPNQYNESETVSRYEIMDGAPVRGETIPIRLFLAGLELTPTYRDINKKFSTRYYLNLVLVDEENRRYFKQQEVTLYRSA